MTMQKSRSMLLPAIVDVDVSELVMDLQHCMVCIYDLNRRIARDCKKELSVYARSISRSSRK